MHEFITLVTNVSDWLQGVPIISLLVLSGILHTVKLGFFQFRYPIYIFKQTYSSIFIKPKGEGVISPRQALTSALSPTVRTGLLLHRILRLHRKFTRHHLAHLLRPLDHYRHHLLQLATSRVLIFGLTAGKNHEDRLCRLDCHRFDWRRSDDLELPRFDASDDPHPEYDCRLASKW